MLAVIYGLPEKFATTIQIKELVKRLNVEKKEIGPKYWPNNFILKVMIIFWNTLKTLVKVGKNDVIYASAPLIASSLPALVAQKFKGAKLIIEWGDAFDDFTKKIPSKFSIKYFEYISVKKADKVVVVSDKLHEMTEKIRNSKDNIYYIPYGVDTKFFNPENFDRSEIRDKYNIGNDILVGTTGFIGRYKGIFAYHEIAETAVKLLKNYNNLKFIIVGFGPGLNDFKKYVNENKIEDKFIFTGHVNYTEIPKYVAAMDICLVPFSNDFTSYTRSSCKTKEFMSMEKPIITMRAGESIKFMDNGKAGILSNFDIEDFEKNIESIINDQNKMKIIGKNARERAIQIYDFDILSKELNFVVQN